MEAIRSFKIVIVYENSAGAIGAKEISERLAAHFESECDAWPFSLLGIARVREHAATMAAEADMIIVAASGREELPDDVKDWVESWLPHKNFAPGALVGLLDDDAETSNQSSVCAYLQRIAERGNMDFICNTGRWMQNEIAHPVVAHSVAAIPSPPISQRCNADL